MRGEDVVYLENKLVDLRYLSSKNGGIYDQVVEAAVRKFQTEKGLESTGQVGPLLWDLIDREVPVFFSRILKLTTPVMSGQDVLLIQRIIKRNARKFGIVDYSMTGKYDEQTAKNIKKIQSMTNFSITGEITSTFFDYLTTL